MDPALVDNKAENMKMITTIIIIIINVLGTTLNYIRKQQRGSTVPPNGPFWPRKMSYQINMVSLLVCIVLLMVLSLANTLR